MSQTDPGADLIDASLVLETATGVEIRLRSAGVCVRGVAHLIDDAIRIGLMISLGAVLYPLGGVGAGLAMLGVFLVWWFYSVVFELVNDGVTPGKFFMGLKAVNADGSPIGFSSSAIRSILLTVDFLPFGYLIGIATMALTGTQQRVGDLVAGTVVVYNQPRSSRAPVVSTSSKPFPATLTEEERTMLLTYQERVGELTNARALELAGILSPALGEDAPATVDDVLAYAEGIRRGV